MKTRYLRRVILIVGVLCVIIFMLIKIWTSRLESISLTGCENEFFNWLFSGYCMSAETLPPSNDIIIADEGYPESWNQDGSELLISRRNTEGFVFKTVDKSLQPIPDFLPKIPNTDKEIIRGCFDWRMEQGSFILLLGELDKTLLNMYLFNPETNQLKYLSDTKGGCPSLSPDGQLIAFEDASHNLAILSRDDLTSKQVIVEGIISAPEWSHNRLYRK